MYSLSDKPKIIAICEEWSDRTKMLLDYDDYVKVIQKDVNNYILIDSDGNIKRKGGMTKKLKPVTIFNKRKGIWHKIKKRDCVERIGRKYHVSYKKMNINELNLK